MRRFGQVIHRLIRLDARGSVAVEFAFVAPIFVLLALGALEVGLAMIARDSVAFAARRGARYAIVRGADSETPASAGDIAAYTRTRAAGLNAATLQVTTTFSPNNSAGGTVNVSTSYSHKLMLPVPGLSTLTFKGSSSMTILR